MNEQLTEKENLFIEHLIENGGKIQVAAKAAGFAGLYGYNLRKKLWPYIVAATQEYLAMHSLRAADRLVQSIEEEMPNAARITAAGQILDRVGISKKDLNDNPTTIKANIFILPEKADGQ